MVARSFLAVAVFVELLHKSYTRIFWSLLLLAIRTSEIGLLQPKKYPFIAATPEILIF